MLFLDARWKPEVQLEARWNPNIQLEAVYEPVIMARGAGLMAIRAEILLDNGDEWFINESKILRYATKDAADAVQDTSGWTFLWSMLSRDGTSMLTVTNGSISNGGITGMVSVPVTAGTLAAGSILPGEYWLTLERVDVNNEGMLSYGPAELLAPTLPLE